jgi:hypothetical protein
MWKFELEHQRVDPAGAMLDRRPHRQRIRHFYGHGAECLQLLLRRGAKVERFARHRTVRAHDRVTVPAGEIDRQSNERAALWLARLDREPRLLSCRNLRSDDQQQGHVREFPVCHCTKLHRGHAVPETARNRVSPDGY